jgi:hypothetical protein
LRGLSPKFVLNFKLGVQIRNFSPCNEPLNIRNIFFAPKRGYPERLSGKKIKKIEVIENLTLRHLE